MTIRAGARSRNLLATTIFVLGCTPIISASASNQFESIDGSAQLISAWQDTDSAIQIIDGSAIKIIDGSAIQAIDGSAIKIIDGSAIKIIDGSAIQAIDGSAIKIIDGSAIKIIDGSAIKIIDGSAIQAIDGSAIQIIDGSAIQIIDGSAIQIIDGSAIQIIDGSAIQIIDGSAIQAIDGSAIQIINGSDIQIIDGSAIRVIDGSATNWTAPISDCGQVIAQGPLSVLGGNKFLILNQVVLHSLETDFSNKIVESQMAALYADARNHTRVAAVSIGTETYTPGSSVVALTNTVSSKNSLIGRIKIGDQTVDYTTIMDQMASIDIGDIVTVTGIQPLPGGVIQALNVCRR